MNFLSIFDTPVQAAIISLRSNWLTKFFLTITKLGDAKGVITVLLLAILILLFIKKRLETVVIMLSVIGGHLLIESLKLLFQRPRPAITWLTFASGYSFPSGHSLITVAFYGLIALLLFKHLKPSYLKKILIILFLLIPFIVGISRIYLGVHYPTDVLAGWFSGFLWIKFCFWIINHLEQQKQ